ncbi:hypothetical protein PPTG_03250 [Phytophthora nicotianae INRA-310]|uniref:Uncharacterized protein n=1 Tax=Phytophthora nicotianae (strain INRA-310) TaxID=761204 RepID=W2R6P9_PHYN3|nr:hypothetical protein PPTG_03250 [Phytophthora nicotianae INRA-310]ETN20195.1 hypothetical protein PPTG_03250 [Phytophthora nicotianae INRA-310]
MNLQLVLENEALKVWQAASDDNAMTSPTQFTKAYACWGRTDDSEGKVITSALKGSAVSTGRPMRLVIRLSQTKEKRVALLDNGCATSYINAKLVTANQKLGFKKNISSMTFEQADGKINSNGNKIVKFRLLARYVTNTS